MKQKKRSTDLLIFKRWTRKPYAAFSSMHKVVKICAITLGCSFLSLPAKSSSLQVVEDSVSRSIELSPIEIVADELLQNDGLLTNNLNATISQKQIQSLPVQSLSDILENLPGLDIRQRGPFNTQADISYRGGTFEQTILLLNGINFSDPQTGHYLLNLPFGADAIRKIDLFSNTTSYLFGASPFSGLMNIITAARKENSVTLNAMGGMYGLGAFSASANLSSKHYRQFITAGHERSDGYMKNTDFKHSYGFYHGIGDFDAGKLEFQIGYTDRAYGANSFYLLKFPYQRDHTKTFIASIRWENKGDLKIIPSAYYRHNADNYEMLTSEKLFFDHITQLLGGNVRTYFDTRAGRTSASVDLRIEDVLSSNLGDVLPEPIAVRGTTDRFYNKRKTRTTSGVSLSQAYRYKGLSVNASLLLQQDWTLRNKYSGLMGKLYPLPAVDVSYRFPTTSLAGSDFDFKTTVSASSAIRMPSFTNLYYDSPNIVGNEGLKTEQARTIEWANVFNFSNSQSLQKIIQGNSNLFVRFGRDMIDVAMFPKVEAKWLTLQHDKIMFVGLNLGTTIHPQALWGDGFFLTQLSLQYDYLYSDKKPSEMMSRYLLDHLEHKFTTKITHKIYRGLEAAWTISYNKRKGSYANVVGKLQAYQGFWLMDGRISYSYKQMKIYADATNMFNVKYFDFGDLVQPGAWVRAGISYKFNWK